MLELILGIVGGFLIAVVAMFGVIIACTNAMIQDLTKKEKDDMGLHLGYDPVDDSNV